MRDSHRRYEVIEDKSRCQEVAKAKFSPRRAHHIVEKQMTQPGFPKNVSLVLQIVLWDLAASVQFGPFSLQCPIPPGTAATSLGATSPRQFGLQVTGLPGRCPAQLAAPHRPPARAAHHQDGKN